MKEKIIAIYEIIAGIGGIILTLMSIDLTDNLKIIFALLSLLFFGLVFLAGFSLLRNPKSKKITYIAQMLQIFNFNLFGLKYIFCSGAKINIDFLNIEIDFAVFMEQLIVGYNSKGDSMLAINIIPIFVLVFLFSRWS